MRLIKRAALQFCEGLWFWLAANPEKRKEDYPEWERNGGSIPRMYCDCPCCAYVLLNADASALNLLTKEDCKRCPLFELWPAGDNCENLNSPFRIWADANPRSKFGRLIRVSCATLIANTAREERLRLERKAKLRKEREA